MAKKTRKSRSLDTEVVVVIVAVLLLAGIVQIGLFNFSITKQFTGLEYAATEADSSRIIAAIEAEKISLTELTRDYAGWDQARDYIKGVYKEFADDNFLPDWYAVSKLDRVIIASPDAIVLWSGIRPASSDDSSDTGRLMIHKHLPGSSLPDLLAAPKGMPILGFETNGSVILVTCAYPITSSDYLSPPLGWIIFARILDAPLLLRVSERSGILVNLKFDADIDPAMVEQIAGLNSAYYFDLGRNRHVLLPIKANAGGTIAVLEGIKPRQLDAPAKRLLWELALSLLVATSAIAIVLLPLLRKLMVQPLAKIARYLEIHGTEGLVVLPLGMGAKAGRGNEIGIVADRIDDLIQNLDLKRVELECLNKELLSLASIDHLTGLSNRRSFDDYAAREIKRLSRNLRGENHKESIAILLADIDHFKFYNDRYGHLAGDECLQAVSGTIRRITRRPTDMACRFGGEEFVILLPETALEGAKIVAENLLSAIAELRILHEDSPVMPFVTLSIGIAASSVMGQFDLPALIEKADAAMYMAKRTGRNRVVASE